MCVCDVCLRGGKRDKPEKTVINTRNNVYLHTIVYIVGSYVKVIFMLVFPLHFAVDEDELGVAEPPDDAEFDSDEIGKFINPCNVCPFFVTKDRTGALHSECVLDKSPVF